LHGSRFVLAQVLPMRVYAGVPRCPAPIQSLKSGLCAYHFNNGIYAGELPIGLIGWHSKNPTAVTPILRHFMSAVKVQFRYKRSVATRPFCNKQRVVTFNIRDAERVQAYHTKDTRQPPRELNPPVQDPQVGQATLFEIGLPADADNTITAQYLSNSYSLRPFGFDLTSKLPPHCLS